jgi:hypothetical protein
LTVIIEFIGTESPEKAPLESMHAPIQAILNSIRVISFDDDPEAFETYAKMCAALDEKRKQAFDTFLYECAAGVKTTSN